MTELQRLANDPNFIVEFAVGHPKPNLVAQDQNSGLHFCRVHSATTKRYVLKSAHMSREDLRIFDIESGRLVLVSHHPGKNPYEMLDPLGVTDEYYGVAGGEWNSLCDVTAMDVAFQSFKIRPKWMSRHGTQYVKTEFDDSVVLSVSKMSKLKTMSLRDHFKVCEGKNGNIAYKVVVDMLGRTSSIYNNDGQLVAQIAKTKKALIKSAVFGSGNESTIDIAAGVDCSVVLAMVLGIWQVGQHCKFCASSISFICATHDCGGCGRVRASTKWLLT